MKSLNFHFSHPVTGVVKLFNKTHPKDSRQVALNTKPDFTAVISLNGLPTGQWRATIEWEYEGKSYFYQEDFEIEECSV